MSRLFGKFFLITAFFAKAASAGVKRAETS